MIDLIESVVGLVMFVVTTIMRWPLILILVAAGCIAFALGGVGGWAVYIVASLIGTGLVKRLMGKVVRIGLVAWGFLQIFPMGGWVMHMEVMGHKSVGVGIALIWIAALVIVGWKVPNRNQYAVPKPKPPHD